MQDMQPASTKNFGKIRNFFWPIHSYELKKLVPMFALFFLISFIYNLLRCMKVSLIVTADNSGVEVIPFLKIGAVLPGALLLTYVFTKLINRYNREQVFYTILCSFLAYFALFMFVLYPHNSYLQFDSGADFLRDHVLVTEGLHGLVALIRHWNLTLFYVLSEMWSAVVLSMLFWGFANEVTKVNEAKRFYAIFALGANGSGIFSGLFARAIESMPYFSWLPYDEKNQWMFLQLVSVLFVGAIIVYLFYWLNKSVFHLENVHSLQIPKKSSNISLRECFSYLARSRYLAYIVIIVVSYNVVYNLADVMWTYKVEQTYPHSIDLNAYMNRVASITGVVAVTFAFILSGNVIRYYGWTLTALITPIIWLLTSLGFFSGLVFENLVSDILSTVVSNPANFILLLGSIQICFGRGCKYTLFDETKEIAFIPLSKENQRKGKAIVDGLASRFGKSGGSLIYIVLLLMCNGIANTIPYVSVLILVCIGFWIYAVFGLGRMVSNSIDFEHHNVVDEEISSETNGNANEAEKFNANAMRLNAQISSA